MVAQAVECRVAREPPLKRGERIKVPGTLPDGIIFGFSCWENRPTHRRVAPKNLPPQKACYSSANGRLLLQQSAMINHAPSRRHTFRYFPRSATVVPFDWRIATEYRPVSIAMSPEYSTRVVSTRRSP